MTVTVTPNGFVYDEGPQDGPCVPFDSESVHNLAFEIIDTDELTSLLFVDDNPAGITETGFVAIEKGTHYARVLGDSTDEAQLYDVDLVVTALPVADPGGPYTAECFTNVSLTLDGSNSFDPAQCSDACDSTRTAPTIPRVSLPVATRS